jgi:hypothetical protein
METERPDREKDAAATSASMALLFLRQTARQLVRASYSGLISKEFPMTSGAFLWKWLVKSFESNGALLSGEC